MCLELKKPAKIKTTRKDITCYKIVQETNQEGVFEPEFHNTITYKLKEKNIEVPIGYRNGLYYDWHQKIGEGYHSFVHLKDARIYCHTCRSNSVVVECTIERGEKVVSGKNLFHEWMNSPKQNVSSNIILEGKV